MSINTLHKGDDDDDDDDDDYDDDDNNNNNNNNQWFRIGSVFMLLSCIYHLNV